MDDNLAFKNVEGLLVKYLHFFGSYDYICAKYSWYRWDIRIVTNQKLFFIQGRTGFPYRGK